MHNQPVRASLVRILVCALVAGLGACTPRPGPADPFSETSSRRPGVQVTNVRLEVSCDDCSIRYFVGSERKTASARRSWQTRLNLTPLIPTAIRLEATPTPEGTAVRELRIWVDGALAARHGCPGCEDDTSNRLSGDRRTRAIEVVVPLNR